MCDYGDKPQFWSEKNIRKARKIHECCECNSEISINEPYIKAFSVLDGCGETHKFCQFCYDLRQEFRDELSECAIGSAWDILPQLIE